MQSDSSSWRATRSWDADRFELQVGNQDQDQGMQSDSSSWRATRSWDADRFELQLGNQGRRDDHGGNQVLGMQSDSSSWRQPVGNQVLGCSQIRAHFSHRSTRAIADRFELQVGNQDQDQGMQSDSSSWRQPGQPGPGMQIDSSSRWATRTRGMITGATRSWGCSQIRAHGVNRWATRPWGCSLIRAHGVNRWATGGQPAGNQALGMQIDFS